jgi:alkylation response protein AidB-like acyl-CoA dehydrogenase
MPSDSKTKGMCMLTQPAKPMADILKPYLDRVELVAPIAAETADWAEAHSQPAEEFVDALRNQGLFRLLVPESLGGPGFNSWEIGPVIEAMARVDGSAGWTLGLGQGVLGQLLSSDLYEELFGDLQSTMAGSLNPVRVRAERVDGGYQFSGVGSYVSGCTHASWMVAAGLVTENGEPEFNNDAPVIKAGVLPMSECEIQETWNMTGMRGTGSHDVAFSNVFVPDDLTFEVGEALANLGALLAPVSLGIAQHAIDAFVELATVKVPTGSRDPLRNRVSAQTQLGEAQGLLQAARSFHYETSAEGAAWHRGANEPSNEDRARLRLGSVMAAQFSARAVDLLYDAAGLTAGSLDCAIARCWRDVHVARQHIALASTRFEVVGRVSLGMPPGSPLI